MVGLGHADLERRVARYVELIPRARSQPGVRASQFVIAMARDAFHDFGRAGVEGQGGWQHDAH